MWQWLANYLCVMLRLKSVDALAACLQKLTECMCRAFQFRGRPQEQRSSASQAGPANSLRALLLG